MAGRGRPPLDWIDVPTLARVEPGTAVVIEWLRHAPTLRCRVIGLDHGVMGVRTRTGYEDEVDLSRVKRARVVDTVFDEDAPLVLVGVPTEEWRGGIVACEGTKVLVQFWSAATKPRSSATETGWFEEDQLEDFRDREARMTLMGAENVPV